MQKKIVWFVAIVLSLGFFMTACSSKEPSKDTDPKAPNEHHEETAIKLTPQAIQENDIQIAVVGPKRIGIQIEVVGKIVPNRNTMAFIYPRYAGVIKTLSKELGAAVAANEVLATVESNESLQTYELRSPIAGTIIQKQAVKGEQIKENQTIYEVANLDSVWADLSIYRKDAPFVKVGQPVTITSKERQLQAKGVLHYVAPVGIEDSQSLLARVILSNLKREWVAGMYIDAAITIQQKEVPLAVKTTAIQKVENHPVVFVKEGDAFVPVKIETGIQDDTYIEVTKGLRAGQHYVSKNAFVLKAELGKSEAEHEH